MMTPHLIIGNIFAFLAAICIAVSVMKKNKKDLIWWQIFDVIFCIFSCIALYAYAALATNFISLIRNILAHQNKLTKNITLILLTLSIVFGLWSNNLGLIGLLPIIASGSYTILMFITKNDQQMRWALVFNLILWFIHDFYIKAYPLALTDLSLSIWTFIQIVHHRKRTDIKSGAKL